MLRNARNLALALAELVLFLLSDLAHWAHDTWKDR